MSRSESVENLYSLPRAYSSEIYTSAETTTKIEGDYNPGKPNFPQKEVIKWKRVHERSQVESLIRVRTYCISESEKNQPAKRVLSLPNDGCLYVHSFEWSHLDCHCDNSYSCGISPSLRYLNQH